MSRFNRTIITLLSLGLLVTAVGCQEPAEGMTPDEQAAQGAAARIMELEDLLNQAEQGRIAAEDDALALRTERDRLKDELAALRAAAPAAGWDSVPGGAMTSLDGTVLFESGKATIKSAGKKTLEQVARVIVEKFPDHEIYIFGHTDTQPIRKSGWKDNYELSCQRAWLVLRFFKSAGVTQQAAACGWGEDRPAADNRTANARQANRRVEVFAMVRKAGAITGSASAAKP